MADTGRGTTLSRPRRWVAPAVALGLVAVVVTGARIIVGRAGDDPDQIRRTAESDFQSGRQAQAEAGLARLTNPGPPDWILKARVAGARNHPDEALAALARVPDDDPLSARALLLAGQIELRKNRLRAAEESLLAAVERDPSLVQAHRELIYIYSVQLRRRELAARFRALAGVAPLTFEDVFVWCLTRNTVWEPHELAGHLRKFVAADPTDRWSRVSLAESLRQLGRLGEAEGVLAVLPESDPDARAVRVRIALDRGEDREAETLLDGGPADHPELARLRGRFALAHRDGPSAVRHFRAAYEAEPDDRDSVFGLGASLDLIGDHAAAAPLRQASKRYDTLGSLVARAAVPTNRGDLALMRALGAACEAVRRLPESWAWYNLVIQISPADQEAQRALHRLKSSDPTRR